jgi:hypothetical protein
MSQTEHFTGVRAFLLGFLSNVDVVQAQRNRVPTPAKANFITMTHRSQARQATNQNTWLTGVILATSVDHAKSTSYTMQLDVHGPAAADNADTIATLWRDVYACEALAPFGIQPLYADDPQQLPFMNGEEQYTDRFVINLVYHGTPTVSTPQDFAATLDIEVMPIPGG